MKKMKAVLNNGYLVYSNDINILIELLTSNNEINWHLFDNGEYFYSDNCEEYIIDGMNDTDKTIVLIKCK